VTKSGQQVFGKYYLILIRAGTRLFQIEKLGSLKSFSLRKSKGERFQNRNLELTASLKKSVFKKGK